ncbi:hypothetical protein [Actinokineospora sp. NBRC 105648]|uniref:DUF6923 family protein n=1 Tax=Actinokineospora sp. NBRC 105648 TaxID=3032206 RepID=UPI0024A596B5|nr:hypothetical protein [Actinokineospora sp. NBRC 105648]GLZ42930.1 hypothetical protein Acsp05_65540 [Actinokineospora sp. NBRC 105648]
MNRRTALAGVSAACVALAGGALLSGGEGQAAPIRAADCVFYRVHSTDRGLSTLSRVQAADGTVVRIGGLGHRVNAVGYSVRSNTIWGLSTRSTGGSFDNGAHVVSIAGNGAVVDYGQVHRINGLPFPAGRLAEATAGTVVGDLLVVRDRRALFSIDVNPASNTFLGLVAVTPLWPSDAVRDVDDFDFRATDRRFYGVTTDDRRSAAVLRIDPDTGRVSTVDGVRLPGAGAYGAVVVGPDNSLYATVNDSHDRSRLFRVGLAGGQVDEVAAWAAVSSSDATGCLPSAAPPVIPPSPSPTSPAPQLPEPPNEPPPVAAPPAPLPVPVPVPAPRTTVATTSPAAEVPVLPPPVVVPEPVRTQPALSPTPIPVVPPARATNRQSPTTTVVATSDRTHRKTEKKRRWGLTVLILVIGAGAAAASSRRRH